MDLIFKVTNVPESFLKKMQGVFSKLDVKQSGEFTLELVDPKQIKVDSFESAAKLQNSLHFSGRILDFMSSGLTLFTAQELLKTKTPEEANKVTEELLNEG